MRLTVHHAVKSLFLCAVPVFLVAVTLPSAAHADTNAPGWKIEKLAFVDFTGSACWEGRRTACPPGEGVIYIKDSLTSRPRKLVAGIAPSWLPDGKRIAYCAADRHKVLQVWIADANGSNRQQLTRESDEACQPACSPDGQKIAFHTAGGIFTMDLTGGNVTRIVRGEYPRWSPDGTQILFSRGRDVPQPQWPYTAFLFPPLQYTQPNQKSSLWVVNADGSGLREVFGYKGQHSVGSWISVGSWFPDGKSIAIAGTPQRHAVGPVFGREDSHALFRVGMDGAQPVQFSDVLHSGFYNPTLSPDGKQFLAVENDGFGSAVVLIDLSTRRKNVIADGGSPSVLWAKQS